MSCNCYDWISESSVERISWICEQIIQTRTGFIDSLNEQSQEWFIHNSQLYKNTEKIKDKYQELHFFTILNV